MKIPQRLINHLNDQHVTYETIHHAARFTAQELAAIEHVKGRHHAKVVMLSSDGHPMMAVLPSDRWVDGDKLEALIGKPAKIATEEEFKTFFPDCDVGAMPPFGDLYGMPTYMDRSLMDDDWIVFEAGTHTDAMKMAYRDYERVAHPIVGDIAFGYDTKKAA